MTERILDSQSMIARRTAHEHKLRKASFDDIYNAPHPGPYFSTLKPLDYRIPHFAQPVIRRLIAELRKRRRRDRMTVLDLCSGYAVNGALMKYDINLDDLYGYYGAEAARSPQETRAAFESRRFRDDSCRVIGQDVAGRALAYAKAAGFLDETLHANLEEKDLTEAQEDLIAETDLITITGGLSYIGEATLMRIFGALNRPPWILYFPLRGADTDAVNDTLCEAGLRPERWHKPLPQRRFANDRERRNALDVLDHEIDGLGPPSSTYHQAVLNLARPDSESDGTTLSSLITGLASPLVRPEN